MSYALYSTPDPTFKKYAIVDENSQRAIVFYHTLGEIRNSLTHTYFLPTNYKEYSFVHREETLVGLVNHFIEKYPEEFI